MVFSFLEINIQWKHVSWIYVLTFSIGDYDYSLFSIEYVNGHIHWDVLGIKEIMNYIKRR